MSAAQGWDRNRRRGGGAAGSGGGGGGHRPPPARSGHRCVADNTNLYVFGGYNPDYDESGGPDNEDYPLFRELWRYHFATGVWHQMGTDGYMPRELASMSLVLHGNNLLVFGGTGIPFGESNGNDVHVCNVKYKRWALLSCRGKKPSRIYGQAMAIINGSLYVFGGTTGYIYSTDLHKLDLNTREWTQLKPNNLSCDLPEERYRHEIAHDGQRIYILGGGTSWTAYSLNKIHAYNLETNAWEEIATKPHEKIGFPAARRCHSCVQIKNDVFICGGYNGEVILGDIWKLNLQTFQWVKLPATMPEPVYFHCAAVTPGALCGALNCQPFPKMPCWNSGPGIGKRGGLVWGGGSGMQEADDILDTSCLGGTHFLIWGNKFFVNLDPKMA
ncbi:kelch domain-containing protein 10 isoform X6 [Neofelis nebulosa]|uniref:kelch domain-containing protein 10 isoform X6 n=1 Tax=Neofelis nebulosa TaxID=61452 RepID=UPI00272D2067|nr:kelch domain-containing protein 10 isoform X6 [Neofelis nebulosa]